jgi:histidyl-tRNA synthetase
VDESQVGIGSIAAGGRYDNLVGAFLAGSVSSDPNSKEYKKALANSVPCVGVSIGMDRIFALVWQRYLEKGARTKDTMVFVMSAGDGLLEERVGLVRELREAGVKVRNFHYLPLDSCQCFPQLQADFLAKSKPKIQLSSLRESVTKSPLPSSSVRTSSGKDW